MGKRVLLRKCGHTKYQVRKDFSRTCNICSDTESPTVSQAKIWTSQSILYMF